MPEFAKKKSAICGFRGRSLHTLSRLASAKLRDGDPSAAFLRCSLQLTRALARGVTFEGAREVAGGDRIGGTGLAGATHRGQRVKARPQTWLAASSSKGWVRHA